MFAGSVESKMESPFRERRKVTLEIGEMKANFLDVTLDLHKDTYRPFRKPNSQILYIDINSNHPRHIKKELPNMIQKRLCTLSKTNTEFNQTKDNYESALKKSGHKSKLEFKKDEKKTKRTRKRKCIFYNPPYPIVNRCGRTLANSS